MLVLTEVHGPDSGSSSDIECMSGFLQGRQVQSSVCQVTHMMLQVYTQCSAFAMIKRLVGLLHLVDLARAADWT